MGGREEYRQKTNWEGAARWKETWVEVEADFPYPRWAWAQCQHSEWTAGVRSEVESRAVNLKSALRTITLARPLSLHFAFTDCHSFLCTELSKVWQWPSKAQRAFFFFSWTNWLKQWRKAKNSIWLVHSEKSFPPRGICRMNGLELPAPLIHTQSL